MAEEEKSAGSGFGKLVYGTLKGNGINTDDLSFDEAVKKFNELGGTDNWHAKILRKEAEENKAKEERNNAEKQPYSKTKLSETGIPLKDQDAIRRNNGIDEVESYKDGDNTFIKYKTKNGEEIELKYDKDNNHKRIYHEPSRSIEEVEKEMDADVKERIESACEQHNLDKQKVMEYLIEKTKANGSNKYAVEQEAGIEFGAGINWRNPSEELKEYASKEKSATGDFESEWARMSKAMDEDDIDTQNEALENVEKLLPFKSEEEHEKWLDLAQSYKSFEEFEEATRNIMENGNKNERKAEQSKPGEKEKVNKNAKAFMDKAKKGEIKPEGNAPKEFKWNDKTNSYEYGGANVMKSFVGKDLYEVDVQGEELIVSSLDEAKKKIDQMNAYAKKHNGYMYGQDKYI